jgi:hypothetical protein
MGVVRISQLDGKLPNVALLRLSAWHRERGDTIRFFAGAAAAERHLDEPAYDKIYGSAIFTFSKPLVERFRAEFPEAIVGGTGTGEQITVEELIGEGHELDYSIARGFTASIGFTQRGCRLRCKFCVVPAKEGKARSANTVHDIWRGPGHPKNLHLLDNDFFGQPRDSWLARIAEIREGGFKVCFSQGINIRMVDREVAQALASIEYRDDSFRRRRLMTAWDNLKDERKFFQGVELLDAAGVPPKHLMAYMLVGFDKHETWSRLFHRFHRMAEIGIKPYPMIFGEKKRGLPDGGSNISYEGRTLGEFQRWVVTGLYRAVEFSDYDVRIKRPRATDMAQAELSL